ncbi:hypothetical protein J2W49_003120 [Hydrogenophaga palleronii]|uniref:Haemolysin activator HlyB C-terminal domain-containing protein n=1 Tax=Hydrogenophaga palleronii TaxID=65655 RepID=A0ABU1WQ53_9BURK|nr:hypothetical protein [Hydrogenophaga palleronii]MDR7151147.1 hypothetical protein [Hydrogenophaga palleronii]
MPAAWKMPFRHALALAMATSLGFAAQADGLGLNATTRAAEDVVSDRDTPSWSIRDADAGTRRQGLLRPTDWDAGKRIEWRHQVAPDEHFSAVAHVLISPFDAHQSASLEGLYGQVKPLGGVELRAGRMVLPLFLGRQGASQRHWQSAPEAFYGVLPVAAFDGLQAEASAQWLGARSALRWSAGKAKAKVSDLPGHHRRFDGMHSLNLVFERGDWSARLGRTENASVASEVGLPNVVGRDVLTGVGLQYDNGYMVMATEHAMRQQGSVVGERTVLHLTGGRLMGPMSPYMKISRQSPQEAVVAAASAPGRTLALGGQWGLEGGVLLRAEWVSTTLSSLSEAVRMPTPADSRRTWVTVMADLAF